VRDWNRSDSGWDYLEISLKEKQIERFLRREGSVPLLRQAPAIEKVGLVTLANASPCPCQYGPLNVRNASLQDLSDAQERDSGLDQGHRIVAAYKNGIAVALFCQLPDFAL